MEKSDEDFYNENIDDIANIIVSRGKLEQDMLNSPLESTSPKRRILMRIFNLLCVFAHYVALLTFSIVSLAGVLMMTYATYDYITYGGMWWIPVFMGLAGLTLLVSGLFCIGGLDELRRLRQQRRKREDFNDELYL